MSENGDSNPIPEKLRCDHLFLLIGTNPLPNFVATRLLLRQSGQVYLIHTPKTIEVARSLAQTLLKANYPQPMLVSLSADADDASIAQETSKHLAKIRSGRVGLNYTGGTKEMAIHTYRTIERELPRGVDGLIFSYLDADTLKMHFDRSQVLPTGYPPIKTALESSVSMTAEDMLKLHFEYEHMEMRREVIAWSAAEALEKVHRSADGFQAWRGLVRQLRKSTHLETERLDDWPREFSNVARTLAQGQSDLTLEDAARRLGWRAQKDKPAANSLVNWLDGGWLESYVGEIVRRSASDFGLTDFGLNLKVYWKPAPEKQERRVEVQIESDVLAVRGYQLFLISCQAGQNKGDLKQHLFEMLIRARQIGGDAAGAALVCMSEDTFSLERDVAHAWELGSRVKVFGRRELQDLGVHLGEWFSAIDKA